MSMSDDLRLIEDYLPIEAISAEASREKSVRKGHISTLHLWWARRPLVACRAAVYGALVPADRWVKEVSLKNPPEDSDKATKTKNGKKKGLNRKAAKEFVTKLCRYPKTDPSKPEDIKLKRETEAAIVEAQRHILEAHADRLSAELADASKTGKAPAWVDEFKFKGQQVTYDDIAAGRAPRPRVLDMFAGGGAIPLEALRLGCEAYALDLNPVAHVIQLCTLVYPQKYGKTDPAARGMTGPKNAKGESTWGGLANEVRYWGNWVLDRVRKEIGDLYPPIPDPRVWSTPPEIAFDHQTGQWIVTKAGRTKRGIKLEDLSNAPIKSAALFDDVDEDGECESGASDVLFPPGFLQPIAYLWTRTVRCKNPSCASTVPMVKQTWLCRKKERYVAAKPVINKQSRGIDFEVCEADSENGIGFDPTAFSTGGNASCFVCGTVADDDYVKGEGLASRLPTQLMSVVAVRRGEQGKVYLGATPETIEMCSPPKGRIQSTLDSLAGKSLSPPDELIIDDGKNSFWCNLYGITKWGQLFTDRQNATLLTFCSEVRDAQSRIMAAGMSSEVANMLTVYLALMLSRTANFSSTLCLWNYTGGRGVVHSFSHQAVPLTWDFPESNPLYPDAAGWRASVEAAANVIEQLPSDNPAIPIRGDCRGTADSLPLLDAIITDPPYYDNISYADLADFFFVWLKRAAGTVLSEHLSGGGTPKKNEIVMDLARHSRDRGKAKTWFENAMTEAFAKAGARLRGGGSLVCVYAHKTTLGWATLVDAMRRAGFEVTEAWPLATERSGGMKVDRAMLASSIFLVGRKRSGGVSVGNYEDDVQPELQRIVRERVETLWEMGIAGADLVIACVGAGLRAFTKYERVEYANGEEVPAEKFLAEVEGAVLDTMLGKLFGQSGTSVSAIDPASRFYILWRFVYKATEIDAGEAIVFTYAQHVELDGPHGLSTGKGALVEKKKAKYRTRDFSERGDNDKLGLPDDGQPAPLIDVLHRLLWLVEHGPRKLPEFLIETNPDRERLRVLAQALAGAALSGKSGEDAEKLVTTTVAEQAALGKLLANWKSLVEHAVVSKPEREDKKTGQKRLEF